MVRDLSTKSFAVGQSRDRMRERFGRQLSQPQRQVGGGRRFCEGATLDYAREGRRGIEPGPRAARSAMRECRIARARTVPWKRG